MSDFAIGIDLGTSTSEICVYRNGDATPLPDPITKIPVIPSIVAVNRSKELLVGDAARGLADVVGQGVREIKRQMGTSETVQLLEQDYRPEEISALILRKLKENAEEAIGTEIKDVVLSVPANFPDSARQATLNAGEIAGLNIVRLINEPTAAALAFGIKNIEVEEQLIIFDFGGGTLDITVLEMMAGILDVQSSFGNPFLGGKDFDEAMITLIQRKFEADNPDAQVSSMALRQLKEAAENAKKVLSAQHFHEVRIPFFAAIEGQPIDLEVEVSRQEFEQAIEPLLEKTRECVRQALAAKKLNPDSIDRVLLVGGTTYIPAVRELVKEMFGKEPKADVNPDLAVGIGAATQAALVKDLISEESGVILTDVAPFGLGIGAIHKVGNQFMMTYDSLIRPNTTIPYSVKRPYSLVSAAQESVEIRLYQDHTGTARLIEDAVDTGIAGDITNIPPAPDGRPYPVEIEFSYDVNGIAKVKASIPQIQRSIEIAYGESDKRMGNQAVTLGSQRIQELWMQNAKARQYKGVINRAERYMAKIPPEERSPLSRAVMDLKEALMTNDIKRIESTGDRLVDLMFDIGNN
ncbi:MAG: Hsp70 family protein [Leptolyngbyaceae cyanobacterium]